MYLLYKAAMHLFSLVLHIYGFFKPNIREWNVLRQTHFDTLPDVKAKAGNKKIVWMHCASLGEYEQGVALLRRLRQQYQDAFFLLTFFSPSGYLQKKHAPEADVVLYLPVDTNYHSTKMVATLQPSLFIGVKYEFWWNLLSALNTVACPTIYISVKVKPTSYLWKKYSSVFRKILAGFTHIYTQDASTVQFLQQHNITNTSVAGDTRVLGVLQRKDQNDRVPELEKRLPKNKKIIVYGSIYLSDLPVIKEALLLNDFLHIIVPHNVSNENLKAITSQLPSAYCLWSDSKEGMFGGKLIVVDAIGKLFDLYRFASLAYIGGGFERNVHNTLEAAVFGLPIAFGPRHQGFYEIEQFLKMGLAYEVLTSEDLLRFVNATYDTNKILNDVMIYFDQNKGSVDVIMEGINKNFTDINS